MRGAPTRRARGRRCPSCRPASAAAASACIERLPARAERRNSDCAAQGFERVLRRIKQGIDLGDRHALGAVRELLDAIAGADFAFLYDAEIKAGPVVRNQQRGISGCSSLMPTPVAGVAWLADLDDGAADPEAIADADLVIGEALHCEVLAENPGHEIRPPKIVRPVAVGVELVDHDRTLLAAMAAEVPLAVAIEIEPAGENPPRHRRLPDPRPDGPALPRDVLGKSDINRNDHAHL